MHCAKQLERDLTFSSETALNRVAWQEANICASVRVGRMGKQVLVPMNEIHDTINSLQRTWDMAMEEKIGPKRSNDSDEEFPDIKV